MVQRLYQVDCRVAGCRFDDVNYYCNFIYNGTNSSILADEVLTYGITLPVAKIGLSTANSSIESEIELVPYQYLGSLQVASAENYYTSGQNGEAIFWFNGKLLPASVFNDHYISKTKCPSDPNHRSKIYFDTVNLDQTLLGERIGLVVLTITVIISLSIVIFLRSSIDKANSAKIQLARLDQLDQLDKLDTRS